MLMICMWPTTHGWTSSFPHRDVTAAFWVSWRSWRDGGSVLIAADDLH
jgi:hypothetical protein